MRGMLTRTEQARIIHIILKPGVLVAAMVIALSFTFPQYNNLKQAGDYKYFFTGHLGHYPIELYIEKNDRHIRGKYIQRFKQRQRSIDLTGYIDQEGKIHLNGKGLFIGTLSNGRFEGYWYRSEDSREKYPFVLNKKQPSYYLDHYWVSKSIAGEVKLQLPRQAKLTVADTGDLFRGHMPYVQSIPRDESIFEKGYRIHLPLEDSSIVSRFEFEMAVYKNMDSLQQLFPVDTLASYPIAELKLDNKRLEMFSYEEGTMEGSYQSTLYFYHDSDSRRSFLFHLSYSYTNPWVYGNPYSKEEYEGPYINDMNRLIEIVEMIIASL